MRVEEGFGWISISEEDLESVKSYSLGRYQMGAQTVGQVSNFYIGRYFADDFGGDYAAVPDLYFGGNS